jgi:hypothetical protein
MTKTRSVSGKIRFPGSSFSGLFLQASCHVSQHSFWFAAVGDADPEDPDSQDGSSVSAGLLHHAGLRDRDWILLVEGAERLRLIFGFPQYTLLKDTSADYRNLKSDSFT